jgi:hypothetical protein
LLRKGFDRWSLFDTLRRLAMSASLAQSEARSATRPLRELAAIFLLSAAMLGIQIGWTRIFSFMIWYHFAFLVISTAMLGFTVGGLLLNLRPSLLARAPGGVLFASATAFALSTAVALVCVCNLPFDGGVLDSPRNFLLFLVLILLVASGFLAAGLFIAFVLGRNPERAASIYGANMVGSGVGCGLSVLLLEELLPATAVLAFALLAWLGALLLVPATVKRRRAAALVSTVGVVLAVGFASSRHPLAAPFYMRSTKPFPALTRERIHVRLSNSLSTIDLFEAEELTGLWGLSDERYASDHPGAALPDRIGFCIDGWALTFGYHAEGEITEQPVFDYLPSTIAYEAVQPKSALIVGAGGGLDVICALRRGAREVTAVEINAITLGMSVDGLHEFNGGIYRRPGVEPVVAEGRSFITAAGERRWDLIQLSGVDTLAASQAGAFTLAESYLYTREAFESYLEHLHPGGVLTLTRWMFDPPRHSLRVITIADAALRKLGIRDTRAHIMLIADARKRFGVFLISLTPFTRQQSQRVFDASIMRGFVPLALPHRTIDQPPNVYERLLRTHDKTQFVRDYPFDISATTDDRPFFFEHSKWRNVFRDRDYILDRFNGHLILLATTAIVALLGALFILIPARYGLARARRAVGDRRTLLFFGCLGLGYVLVEMVLVQKLTLYLGNPVYALAVVLCAMLIFSGLGSALSPRVRLSSARAIVAAACAVAIVLVVYRFALGSVLTATLHLSLGGRIALALVALAPPAMLMGVPFPAAVSTLGDVRRDLVVRGWVLNGYFSVLGACLAMVASISFGFSAVLLLGAALYAAAAFTWSSAATAANVAPRS